MMGLLNGKALITGAGSGIGRAVALACATYGCTALAIADLHQEGLQETSRQLRKISHNLQVVELQVNVGKADAVIKMVQDVMERFDRLDYAFNVAGAELRVMLSQEPTVSRESDSPLRAQRGSIINIASTCGSMVIEDMMPYIVSKHAVLGVTKAAAVDHAHQKVRINAVSPGLVETPMIAARRKQSPGRKAEVATADSARFLPADIYSTPLGRLALAEEVADACIFLASTMSSHTTASFVNVDGGRLAIY
ncbi:hypothetical protein FCOIX_13898 [Fusarium coicis]|nr:hypothetical protein FCOIX_13898 [Fusarium coicis]